MYIVHMNNLLLTKQETEPCMLDIVNHDFAYIHVEIVSMYTMYMPI